MRPEISQKQEKTSITVRLKPDSVVCVVYGSYLTELQTDGRKSKTISFRLLTTKRFVTLNLAKLNRLVAIHFGSKDSTCLMLSDTRIQ